MKFELELRLMHIAPSIPHLSTASFGATIFAALRTGRDLPSLRRQKLHYFGGFTTT
jgi:hypothetical protein